MQSAMRARAATEISVSTLRGRDALGFMAQRISRSAAISSRYLPRGMNLPPRGIPKNVESIHQRFMVTDVGCRKWERTFRRLNTPRNRHTPRSKAWGRSALPFADMALPSLSDFGFVFAFGTGIG